MRLRQAALIPVAALAAVFTIVGAATAQAQGAAEPAPQYSAADFAKAMLSTPVPCGQANEAKCQAEEKTRGFHLATLSADAVSGRAVIATRSTARAGVAAGARAKPTVAGGANVLVTFRAGSTDILPQGRANLKSVAEGMKRASLLSQSFQIAGYTDPRGGQAKNIPLSRSRAEAVMRFLVAEGVKPDRLSAEGYGSDPLVDAENPTAEANRRVEIHRLK